MSVRASIDRLVLGSIPDIGFAGDAGLHGPKRYNWRQLVGSIKYTLWRLQEKVVGKGPGVPQVPVIPSPHRSRVSCHRSRRVRDRRPGPPG